ncbi:hypothetical protein PGIGA_G00238230 [Pangasianodon gigas]|uniref:Uncharacterized protein n=1 Tax=Pangasianodon gigas TaxID=30993 RepID=A0ACC5WN22_PANGG|nr:hypothetical protein [Pangasianodon gigas]
MFENSVRRLLLRLPPSSSVCRISAGGASGSKVLPCSPRPPPLHGSQISDYPITGASDTLADEARAFGADGKKGADLGGGR